jgi:putative heme degradation protein
MRRRGLAVVTASNKYLLDGETLIEMFGKRSGEREGEFSKEFPFFV